VVPDKRIYPPLATIRSNFRNVPTIFRLERWPHVNGPWGSGGWESVVLDLNSKRPSVLLVEDEPLISEIAAEALVEQGFEVEAVENAGDALRRLMSGSRVDILFTDLNLPGDMDGGTLAQRARELRPGLPVIYTSGRRAHMDELEPVEGSMFVPKPYDPFSIGQLLEYLVAMRTVPPRPARNRR
jgi:CheY-like chemotaxis protein